MGSRDVTVAVLIAGDGTNYPKQGNTVFIHYTGYWVNPKGELIKFDSTYDREKPFKFKLGAAQVIQGLDMGVEQLSVSETAMVSIPYKLAYDEMGFPGLIPSKSDLKFEINLISIVNHDT